MQRRYSTNLAFVDLLFNLLIGFVTLFVISYLLINPIAKNGTVDPPTVFMVEASWNNQSKTDIDLYVSGPGTETVYFGNKDTAYMTLERDDLGISSDVYTVNGEEKTVERNYEVISFSVLPAGEYVVNIHNYSRRGNASESVTVTVTSISPYSVVYQTDLTVSLRQELTVASFQVDDQGRVFDLRTDIQKPLRVGTSGGD